LLNVVGGVVILIVIVERRGLQRLRYFTDGVRNIDLGLNDIDFGRTSTFVGARSRMVLASTGARAPSLTGQETKRPVVGTTRQGCGRTGTVDPSLVGKSTDITGVIGVRPGPIGSGSVSRSTELRDREVTLVLLHPHCADLLDLRFPSSKHRARNLRRRYYQARRPRL